MYTHATKAGWISRSHQAISPFQLLQPDTLEEAVVAVSKNEAATFIAGGIDLTRKMRGGSKWQTVIDISGIEELKGICAEGEFIRIGGLTSHWEIETNPLLKELLPQLQKAWATIGNIRIRMTGTIGGNLMAREPGYDSLVLLGAIGATLELATPQGRISMKADNLAAEFPSSSLLVAVRVPVRDRTELGFDRSLKPVVSVAAAVDGDLARVGIGCAFEAPVFWSGSADRVEDDLPEFLPEPIDNPLGKSIYRIRMISVLARRILTNLQGER